MLSCTLSCTPLNKCMYTRLCCAPVCSSNRLIFHISHGQEGQEAARLRPESGYSTVSSARHSLAPPKLSALYQTLELANMHWLLLLLCHPTEGLQYWLCSLTAEASTLGLGLFNFVTLCSVTLTLCQSSTLETFFTHGIIHDT